MLLYLYARRITTAGAFEVNTHLVKCQKRNSGLCNVAEIFSAKKKPFCSHAPAVSVGGNLRKPTWAWGTHSKLCTDRNLEIKQGTLELCHGDNTLCATVVPCLFIYPGLLLRHVSLSAMVLSPNSDMHLHLNLCTVTPQSAPLIILYWQCAMTVKST